jgi:hypothetical protein
MYTNFHEYVLNLLENMLTAGLPHAAAPLDSCTLPRAVLDGRTLLHIAARTAALPYTAIRSAANCSTLHEFEWRTPHTTHRTQSHTANNMN